MMVTLSSSLFFSSDIMAHMASRLHFPSWLNFFNRCACDREGSSLSIVHRFQKILLFFFFQVGQLYRRIESDFLFVYHIQQFRNQFCQTDIAENLIFYSVRPVPLKVHWTSSQQTCSQVGNKLNQLVHLDGSSLPASSYKQKLSRSAE